MKTRFVMMTAALMATTAMVPAFAKNPAADPAAQTRHMTGDAVTFVKKASMASLFEIESSKLALEKSNDSQIKDFAQMVIDDHTRANEKLQSIAESKELQASVASSLGSKSKDKLATLSASANFDTDYLAMQDEAHTKAVALFGNYVAHGDDPDLKLFAKKTLPALKTHQEHLAVLKSNQAVKDSQ